MSMKIDGNVTGAKMLMFIGIVKSFITAGKLRTKGNFPLEQLLDQNAQAGGDLQKLVNDITSTVGATCGIELDISDQKIQEMLDESICIAELPKGAIEIIIANKDVPKKDYRDLSFIFKISLADEKEEPSMALSLNLSAQQIKKIIPLLKNQFLVENRISALISKLALSAILKENGIKEPKKGNIFEMMQHNIIVDGFKKEVRHKEENWRLAEGILSKVFASTKKIPEFSIIVGIHITDKLTIAVDFKQKKVAKKKA